MELIPKNIYENTEKAQQFTVVLFGARNGT